MLLKIGLFNLNEETSTKLYHKLNGLHQQITGNILYLTDCKRILKNIHQFSKYYHEIIDEFDEKEQIFISSVIYFTILDDYSKRICNKCNKTSEVLADTSEAGFLVIKNLFDTFLYKGKLSYKNIIKFDERINNELS